METPDDSGCGLEPQGLRYVPRVGDALLFWSLTPNLAVDPRALHAACPTGLGSTKYVMTKCAKATTKLDVVHMLRCCLLWKSLPQHARRQSM